MSRIFHKQDYKDPAMGEELKEHKKIFAQLLHEMSPQTSPENKAEGCKFWEDWIDKYSDDPDKFFGSNGDGAQEYRNFISAREASKLNASLRILR